MHHGARMASLSLAEFSTSSRAMQAFYLLNFYVFLDLCALDMCYIMTQHIIRTCSYSCTISRYPAGTHMLGAQPYAILSLRSVSLVLTEEIVYPVNCCRVLDVQYPQEMLLTDIGQPPSTSATSPAIS